MGRVSVRAQIASFFAPANVAGLTTMYASRPNRVPPQAFGLSGGGGSGAVMIIYIPNAEERRLTLGGAASGSKFDVHDVVIEIRFQSVKVDAIAANADLDALIDAFKVRFRSDRSLGSTNGVPIWSAGEDPGRIKVELSEPVIGKQNFLQNGLIRFQAFEFIANA